MMARQDEPLTETKAGSVPVPDPTTLTTDAIRREMNALKELLSQRIEDRDREEVTLNRERTEQFDALKEVLTQRLTSMGDLVDEKFASAERQRIEQKADTKAAVDAALTAQKEAVKEQTTASERAIAKSETATTKQLEQQQVTVSTAVDALRRAIDEVKERAVEENRAMRTSISEVATSANGIVQQKVGAKEDRTAIYATIGLLITVVLALMALAAFLATRPGA